MYLSKKIFNHLDFGRSEWESEHAIIAKKYEKQKEDLQEMAVRIIRKGEECSLGDIKDALKARGMSNSIIRYTHDDFREELDVQIGNSEFNLVKALFPNRRRPHSISISLMPDEVKKSIDPMAEPDSIIEYLMEIVAWLPSYLSIEEEIRAKIRQDMMACEIAMDLIRRLIGAKLEEKGYSFSLHSKREIASLEVRISSDIKISYRINLLGDYLHDITGLVESLPSAA